MDYVRKLDMLEAFPILFRPDQAVKDLSEEELEMLRVVVVGDRKQFGHREYKLDQRQVDRLKLMLMPQITKVLQASL